MVGDVIVEKETCKYARKRASIDGESKVVVVRVRVSFTWLLWV